MWLLRGGRVPYVLKPALPGCLPKLLPRYFAGDCYVHGIMKGKHILEKLGKDASGSLVSPYMMYIV